ncbi:MAG: ADP-ribosylglycohydrolase family protein [candidate division Zixibacteria bacterium]|nr:ADP-ribosylglycohydrolase family protein [candidate division Zixibacteria bacterium]
MQPKRFSGCLIGQCLGDALGYPVEGASGAACSEYVVKLLYPWASKERTIDRHWKGQYTDDSQLARELMRSLIESEGWSPDDYADRVLELFQSNRIVGRGIASDNAARRLSWGAGWEEAGELPPSAGNGTAMRAAPVGLFFYQRIPTMIQVAHEQGWITHHDPRCSAGSIAIAGAVTLAIRDELSDIAEATRQLADWMRPFSQEFADLVGLLPEWIDLDPADALAVIGPAGRADDFAEVWPGISPFVVPSVLWSLYSFLKHSESYVDAVATAIAVGGDVDTTAAMTGAISGAYLGLDAIPGHLARRVQDQGTWEYAALVKLAESCCDVAEASI